MILRKTDLITLLLIFNIITLPILANDFDSESYKSQGLEVQLIDEHCSLKEKAKSIYALSPLNNYFDFPDYYRRFKSWNKHISNVENIDGEYIYISAPISPYISYPYIPPLPSKSEIERLKVRNIATEN